MKIGESDERNKEYQSLFNEVEFFRKLIKTKEPIIFDVGAHRGESVKYFKEIWPNSKIYSFEPDPESFEILSQYKDLASMHNLAMSNSSGMQVFYRQTISSLNSLSKVNKQSNDSIGYAKTALNDGVDVTVVTGFDFCEKNEINKIDFLKIDTQGFEENVLLGFGEKLKNVGVITVEISFFDFYEKKSSFYEIEKLIKDSFELYDILKISKNPKNFRTDWVEAVYLNKNYGIS